MSIVRSLLVSIGFQTDKQSVNATNRAITGFKSRFAVVATAATFALRAIRGFFSGIASAVLDSDELAESLGVSLNELQAIQQASEKFRISNEQSTGIFQGIQKDLNEFRQGYGRLAELLRNTKIEINPNTNSLELFEKYIEYIRQFTDSTDRAKVASDIFGDSLGVKISRLSQHFDEWKESVRESYKELENSPDIIAPLTEYEQSINKISSSLNSLFQLIVVKLSPAIQELAKWIEFVVNLYSSILTLDFEGIKSAGRQGWDQLSDVAAKVGDTLENAFDKARNFLDPYITYDPSEPKVVPSMDYGPSWIESQLPESWVNYINNSVDINVPQGTTSEQAQFLGTEIERMVEDSILNTFYQIQSNNPQVE